MFSFTISEVSLLREFEAGNTCIIRVNTH